MSDVVLTGDRNGSDNGMTESEALDIGEAMWKRTDSLITIPLNCRGVIGEYSQKYEDG